MSTPEAGPLSVWLEGNGVATVAVGTPAWTVFVSDEHTPGQRWKYVKRRARQVGATARSVRPWLAVIDAVRPDIIISTTATIATPALAAKRRRIPHVWWVLELCTRTQGLAFALGDGFSRRCIGWGSDAVVANSRAVAARFSPPVRAGKMHLVHNGVAAFPIAPSDPSGDALRLLLFGRLEPAKGCELAIRAVACTEPGSVELRLVGSVSAPYRHRLEQLAATLGIATCVSIYEYEAIPARHLEWSDVVVMCSIDEGFGRVTAEALKSGRTVIGARSGGTTELIEDEVVGLLVEPGSVAALVDAINRLAADRDLVQRLSTTAAARYRSTFEEADEVDAFVELVRRLQPPSSVAVSS